MHTRRILKFGGSSLADVSCFRQVLKIIKTRLELNPVVVVSAVGALAQEEKITDLLKEAGTLLLNKKNADQLLEKIIDRHFALLKPLNLKKSILEAEVSEFKATAERIFQGKFSSASQALDAVMGFGEILCAKIMAAFLNYHGFKFQPAQPWDFHFITDRNFQDAEILEESLEKIANRIISSRDLLVFPGYIGYTPEHQLTTLGRGGSDYTAAVLGAALKRDVEIWTDVDGICRLSPQYLPPEFKAAGHPETIPELSYEEAFQMAAFGSQVLYKKALLAVQQAVKKGKHIQLFIKNTFNPEHPGSIISSKRQLSGLPRGITILEGTQLFNFYPNTSQESKIFSQKIQEIPEITTVLASETWGRLSFVFHKYHPALSELEAKYNSHLSRDQVLVKIVGDGLGENPNMLSKIHGALQSAENPEKHGMTVVHKSPQLLTENTFEFLVKKRGLPDIVLTLYKELFMEKTITIGMLGMGTVGSGVLHYCRELYSPEKGGFDLNFPLVLVKDLKKKRTVEFEGKLTSSAEEVLNHPMVDIVLELMGGTEPARTYILQAFKNGKNVVTANKALLAEHGKEIFEAAYKYRKNLGFEASVCGEIPIIDDFLKFPGLSDIQGIEGIVNGTSNYLLTRFMEGESFEQALKTAQQKGFAEADPYMDISGTDAAQKLAILAAILFNQPVDYRKIPRQGLEGLLPVDRLSFKRWGFIIKPLSLAKLEGKKLVMRVSPALLNLNHPLATVREENNALSLYLKGRAEPITKIGKGAGAIPTARSIVKDLLEVSRKSRAYMLDLPGFFRVKEGRKIAPQGDFQAGWYLRFSVCDAPGVFGKIATILGEHKLSIRHVLQEEEEGENLAHILLELKNAPFKNLEKAVETVQKFHFVQQTHYCMIL